MSFRCNAKNFFLTYPQAVNIETKDELLQFLLSRRQSVAYLIVAKELHEDGNQHYHAMIQYSKRFDLRDDKYFDYKGHHPNIQKVKSVDATKVYIKKDEDYIEYGGSTLHQKCADMNRPDWEEYCIANGIQYAFCKSIWKRMHPHQPNTLKEDQQFPGELSTPLATFNYQFDKKCLVLIGPTGCGKTVWAMRNAPKPALFVSHLDRLKEFDSSLHKSIIFDDMVFTHYPVQSQIHLVDNYVPRDIHIRYTTAHIPADIVKIFTCNERPFSQHEAVNRRIHVFNIRP